VGDITIEKSLLDKAEKVAICAQLFLNVWFGRATATRKVISIESALLHLLVNLALQIL